MAWDERYRRLEEGETILATDEVYRDLKKDWVVTLNCVGQQAPNPNYTSHRQYRRLKEEYMEYPEIPDTPEQRQLIDAHNKLVSELTDLVLIDGPELL